MAGLSPLESAWPRRALRCWPGSPPLRRSHRRYRCRRSSTHRRLTAGAGSSSNASRPSAGSRHRPPPPGRRERERRASCRSNSGQAFVWRFAPPVRRCRQHVHARERLGSSTYSRSPPVLRRERIAFRRRHRSNRRRKNPASEESLCAQIPTLGRLHHRAARRMERRPQGQTTRSDHNASRLAIFLFHRVRIQGSKMCPPRRSQAPPARFQPRPMSPSPSQPSCVTTTVSSSLTKPRLG